MKYAFASSSKMLPFTPPSTRIGTHTPTLSDGGPPSANDLVRDTGGQHPSAIDSSVDLTVLQPVLQCVLFGFC